MDPRQQEEQTSINHFYENLVLLSLLNPIKARQKTLDRNRDASAQQCTLLDDLSCLLDYKRAGASVTSLAISESLGRRTVWIATAQHKFIGQQKSDMAWLVRLLGTIRPGTTQHEADILSDLVAKRSISHSRDRIHNYRSRLEKLMKMLTLYYDSARRLEFQDQIVTVKLVIGELRKLLLARNDHDLLCDLAFALIRKHKIQVLEVYRSSACQDLWYQVIHYVGRLGSWMKISRRIVSYCVVHFNPFSRPTSIKEVPMMHAEGSCRLQKNVSIVIERLIPRQRSHVTLSILTKSKNDGSHIATHFSENVKNVMKELNTRPLHAEVIMLDHFHKKDLAFWNGHRYIGCSKASCYCCDLLFRSHPAKPIIRPSHGNIWRHWRMPSWLSTQCGNDLTSHAIIQNMIQHMTQDFCNFVRQKPGPRDKPLESCTEITRSGS